jgi:hypothetical protein
LLDVVNACGFDLPLILVPRDESQDARLEQNRKLSPERRVERFLSRIRAEEKARGG